MKVGIVTTAFSIPDQNRKMIESALLDSDKHDITVYLFIHSEWPIIQKLALEMTDHPQVKVFNYGNNRGLTRSWNEGILEAYDVDGVDSVIVANDDIIFSPGDVDKISTKAVQCQDNYVLSMAGVHEQFGPQVTTGFSCFAINPIALEKVGMFDENFFPVYMEDCDYAYRATKLAGLHEENVPDTNVWHGGSLSINVTEVMALNNLVTHRKNGVYYVRKWGGLNGEEAYVHPFNDERFDHFISVEDRHHPYKEHDRTDRIRICGYEKV